MTKARHLPNRAYISLHGIGGKPIQVRLFYRRDARFDINSALSFFLGIYGVNNNMVMAIILRLNYIIICKYVAYNLS